MQAEVNGVKYFYSDEGHGSVIVFIHGLGENECKWQDQKWYFTKGFRVIAPDLRGHYRTEDGDIEKISISQFTDDIAVLLRHLNVHSAHFVGFSMGGIVLQDLAIRHEDLVRSLVICNSASFSKKQGETLLDKRLKILEGKTMDEVADLLVRTYLPKKYDQKVYEKAYDIFRMIRRKPYLASTEATFREGFREKLKEIKHPTLILCSEFDRAVSVTSAQYLNKNIKYSKMQVLRGIGHLSNIENPEVFNKAIAEFLLPYDVEACRRILKI